MKRLATLCLVLAATWASPSPAPAVSGFPQAKINHVDVSQAPRIRVFVSLLDKRLRQVPDKWLEEVTVSLKPDKAQAEELFSIVDGEPEFPDSDEGERDEEDLPVLSIAADDERGMAAVVVIPGFAGPEYRDGTLGQRVQNGASLFFKKLGKNHALNVVWYSDVLRTWVRAKGRTDELTPYTPAIRERCEAWRLRELEGDVPEKPEGEEGAGLAEDEAHCGLASNYEALGKIVEREAYQGFYPHLFGLEAPMCTDEPEHPRQGVAGFAAEGEANGPASLPALDVALRMLARDAEPGQPRALILLGDGRDGYIYRQQECEAFLRKDCAKRNDTWKRIKECVDTQMRNSVIKEQELFRARVPEWLALAKAANIRIYSVINPTADPQERERLELLAWRTGGTARVAEDANQVVDLYTDLIEELNGQFVISFTDDEAVPGATRRYEVDLRGSGYSFSTPEYEVHIPRQPEGLALMVADFRAMGEAKLGKKGMMAVAAGVALIVALILLLLLRKILKKAFGKGKKAAKGKAKKGVKGAKKLKK
ncbi:MAG: hypothetical protein ACQEXJ_13690 [Myxococcota bacterium]